MRRFEKESGTFLRRLTFTDIKSDFNKSEITFKQKLASLLQKTCLIFNWLNPKSLIAGYCVEIHTWNGREHWAGFVPGGWAPEGRTLGSRCPQQSVKTLVPQGAVLELVQNQSRDGP